MPFGQGERLRLAAKRDGNILHVPMKLTFRRLLLLLSDIVQIHLVHMDQVNLLQQRPEQRIDVAL